MLAAGMCGIPAILLITKYEKAQTTGRDKERIPDTLYELCNAIVPTLSRWVESVVACLYGG